MDPKRCKIWTGASSKGVSPSWRSDGCSVRAGHMGPHTHTRTAPALHTRDLCGAKCPHGKGILAPSGNPPPKIAVLRLRSSNRASPSAYQRVEALWWPRARSARVAPQRAGLDLHAGLQLGEVRRPQLAGMVHRHDCVVQRRLGRRIPHRGGGVAEGGRGCKAG